MEEMGSSEVDTRTGAFSFELVVGYLVAQSRTSELKLIYRSKDKDRNIFQLGGGWYVLT